MLTTVSTVLTKESPLPFSTSIRNRAGKLQVRQARIVAEQAFALHSGQ